MRFSIRSKWLAAVLLLFLVVFLGYFGKEYSRRYYLQQQINSLEQQIGELENKNQDFSKLLDYFNTQGFTEEEARLKLGLKKPGETVVVVDTPGERAGQNAAASGVVGNLSNAQKWWYYFFNQDVLTS